MSSKFLLRLVVAILNTLVNRPDNGISRETVKFIKEKF